MRENLLNKPVEVGTELLQVADIDGEWVLEVNVADHDMGPILEAQAKLRGLAAPVKEAKAKVDALTKDGISSKNVEAVEEGLDTLSQALKSAEKQGAGQVADVGQAITALADYSKAMAQVTSGSADDITKAVAAKKSFDRAIEQATTLSAYFISATDPEHRYPGYVKRVSTKVETVEQQHTNKLIIGFTDEVRSDFLTRNQALRPGAEVRTRINCGDTRLAYALFRDVVAFYYENLTFRWPFVR